jgi:hypothetical protein
MPNYNQCRVSSGSNAYRPRFSGAPSSGPALERCGGSVAGHERCALAHVSLRSAAHGRWGTHIVKTNPQLADKIVAAVAELGPSTAGRFKAHLSAEPGGSRGAWWIG